MSVFLVFSQKTAREPLFYFRRFNLNEMNTTFYSRGRSNTALYPLSEEIGSKRNLRIRNKDKRITILTVTKITGEGGMETFNRMAKDIFLSEKNNNESDLEE